MLIAIDPATRCGWCTQFYVLAEPKGQPRARARGRKFGDKVSIKMYTPDSAAGFKEAVMAEAFKHKPPAPILGPVRIEIIAAFPRPKGHYRTGKNAHLLKKSAPFWHTGKPDRDNLEKVVLDALTRVGFWRDDAQACAGSLVKAYAADPTTVGVSIEVKELV